MGSLIAAAGLTAIDAMWGRLQPGRRVSLGAGILELVPAIGGFLAVLGLIYLFDEADGREAFRVALAFTASLFALNLALRLGGRTYRRVTGP